MYTKWMKKMLLAGPSPRLQKKAIESLTRSVQRTMAHDARNAERATTAQHRRRAIEDRMKLIKKLEQKQEVSA